MNPNEYQKYDPGPAPKALQTFHRNIPLYPITGLKQSDRLHTLHREYSQNLKAWKDLEVVLVEGRCGQHPDTFVFCT